MAQLTAGQWVVSVLFAGGLVYVVLSGYSRRDRSLTLTAAVLLALIALTDTGGSFAAMVSQGQVTPEPLAVMQWLVACGFLLVGARAFSHWMRYGGRPRLLLAGSIGLLGIESVVAQVWQRDTTSMQPSVLSLGLILLSGYLFYRFRSLVIPVGAVTMRVVTGMVIAAGITGAILVPPSTQAAVKLTAVQMIATISILAVWGFCIGEPCLRLWFNARTLPVVQRMRARSLALGYGGIIAILLVVVPLVLAFQQLGHEAIFAYGLEAFVLATVPLMAIALFPPAWLRRFWRETEEEHFRMATHQLLLGTPDAQTLAAQCLDWAVRLVGADAGCIVGLDGEMLATSNLSREQALMLAGASHHSGGRQALRLTPDEHESNVIIVPMRSDMGAGSIVVVAGAFTPLLGSDEVNRLTQYAASVTAAFDRLILLEKLTDARGAAETASRRKSDHLSRMSHELRTPMSAILGFADLLSLNNPREDQLRDINAIVRAADHLLALINEVLEIALIESGGGALSIEPVRVMQVIDESLTMLGARARADNIALTTDVHAADACVLADNQRLRQVLVNLLSNAVKYNHRDGSVKVSTELRGDQVHIAVSDTGNGVAPETIDRLFEPFDRLGQERSAVEGTGLGLALVRALMDAMHGNVGVEAHDDGVGSTFWIELPATAAHRAPDAVETDATQPAHALVESRTIVYIEDNLVNVELAERVLAQEREQMRLVPFGTGLAGIAYLETHHPGLILLDLHLGDIDGSEVLQRIRANPRLHDIPVVILSADASAAQIEKLMAMGATEYLTKPFRVKTLLRVIDEALAGTLTSSRVAAEAEAEVEVNAVPEAEPQRHA